MEYTPKFFSHFPFFSFLFSFLLYFFVYKSMKESTEQMETQYYSGICNIDSLLHYNNDTMKDYTKYYI